MDNLYPNTRDFWALALERGAVQVMTLPWWNCFSSSLIWCKSSHSIWHQGIVAKWNQQLVVWSAPNHTPSACHLVSKYPEVLILWKFILLILPLAAKSTSLPKIPPMYYSHGVFAMVQMFYNNHHSFVLHNCLLAKKCLFTTQNKRYNTAQTCHVF